MKITKRILSSEPFIAICLVALVTLLTHAPLIPELGFYHDDWYLIWNGHARGYQSIPGIFQADRPFMGMIYAVAYIFLGDSPLNWHLYAFFLQLAGSLAFFWLLRMLWPKQWLATTAATLLFVVYPGFLQQPHANTFQNHFFGYGVAILSIAFTIRAVKTNHRIEAILLSIFSVVLALVYFLIYEYMIGLEGVRLLLLWFAMQQGQTAPFRQQLKQLLKRWSIYLPAIAGFLYWRIFIFKSTRRATDLDALLTGYTGAPSRNLLRLLIETSKDWIETAFFAWAVPFYRFVRSSRYGTLGQASFLALIVIGLVGLYYLWVKHRGLNTGNKETPAWGIAPLWIGAAAILVTMLPVVVAGREMHFETQFDRYTLQATVGVSLFFMGLIFYGIRANLRIWVLFFLLGIGVITHYHNADYYRENWQYQRSLWWQLSWRAPGLEEGAVIVAVMPNDFGFAEAYSSWGPANLIYYPEMDALAVYAEVLTSGTAEKIVRGTEDARYTRGAALDRDYKRTLILNMPSIFSCMHAIDGQKIELAQNTKELVKQVAPYSNIDQIKTDVGFITPPKTIFGDEPTHTWCYYFQKASLARQIGDWEEVARLVDEAIEQDYKPLDLSEWMLILEGYANTNQEKKARNAAKIIQSDKALRYELCTQLATPPAYPGEYNYEFIFETLCK